MPKLPSGLHLGISRSALFDHGGNWFSCPDGHFWYWVPDPEMGPGPYESGTTITQVAQYAAVPQSREEAKRFIHVLEFTDETNYVWRGEWLDTFPRYRELSTDDQQSWNEWLNGPSGKSFLDKTIEECRRLAEVSRHAQGYAIISSKDNFDSDDTIKGDLDTNPRR